MNFKRKETSHIVLKLADVRAALTVEEQDELMRLGEKVALYRESTLRNGFPNYYVVNADEPYAPAILEMIKCGEGMK
jgi:hypothetical protein